MIANLRDLPYGWQLLLIACLAAAVCSGAWCLWVVRQRRRLERTLAARQAEREATLCHIADTDVDAWRRHVEQAIDLALAHRDFEQWEREVTA